MALCCAAGWAQQAVAPAAQKPEIIDDPSTRIILDVTRVNMLFTVTDKKGRFVTDLTQGRIPGLRKQEAADASRSSPLKRTCRCASASLIDTSNSIRERFKFEQEAAVSFIQSVVHQGHDKAMVVSFDTSAELVADLVDDTAEVGGGHPRPASGRRHGALRCHLFRLPR